MELYKQSVALNFFNRSHWSDHLVPICKMLDIPLLLSDETYAQDIQVFYPGLNILLKSWEDINLEYLIKNFDVFFQTFPWHRHDFYTRCQPFEKAYHKTVRNVHCPHGFSDKIFWFTQAVWEDILLVYGDNMLNLFQDLGIHEHLNTIIRSGNYRYLYYRQNQAFYDQLVQDHIWSRLDSSKPTILYAPTWKDREKSSSFSDSYSLIEQLPKDYNLIVKPHPLLKEEDPLAFYTITSRYEERENVVFATDFSPVYPILARSDIYVGDMSSVGYDFLVFNRPMFFLNQLRRSVQDDRRVFLYRCGVELLPEQYKDFYKILESQLPFDQERYGSIRQEVYRYTFGEEVSFEDLRNQIIQAYFSPKKES